MGPSEVTDSILLISDDPGIVSVLVRALQSADVHQEDLASPASAWIEDTRTLETASAVVVDGISQEDGLIESIDHVRRAYARVPIIALVPTNGVKRRIDALAAGANEWISASELEDTPQHAASRIETTIATISDSKDSATPFTDSRNFLAELFEQVPINLYVKDTEGRHVLMSDHHPDSEEIIGDTDREYYPEHLGTETFEDDMHILETGEKILNKEEYNEPTGEWVLTSKVPWYGDDGTVAGVIGVSREITERKEAEDELRRTNERLEHFASILSHDLRNPLTVAKGRAELLANEQDDDAHVEVIVHALERMEQLIEDLLFLAQTGTAIDRSERVELADLVADCWRTVMTQEATLESDITGTIEANRARVAQLVENLIRNAVEHGGDAVTIRIATIRDGFSVADDGPGIDPADRPYIFDEGYSDRDAGTGLGLAIVNRIVEAHGWDITVTESASGGAQFDIHGVTFVDSTSQQAKSG